MSEFITDPSTKLTDKMLVQRRCDSLKVMNFIRLCAQPIDAASRVKHFFIQRLQATIPSPSQLIQMQLFTENVTRSLVHFG